MKRINLAHGTKYEPSDCTFSICAFKESPYLERCIHSLLKMDGIAKENIQITTSTPNGWIKKLSEKYGIRMVIKYTPSSLASDFQFAIDAAKTPLAVIVHQDDIYGKSYLKRMLSEVNHAEHPLIAFSDYYELKHDEVVRKNINLIIKKVLLSFLKFPWGQRNICWRRRIISIGNCICCPSVLYVKENLPDKVFKEGFKSNADWEAWEMLSRLSGDFVYCPSALMLHRIHAQSATTRLINSSERVREDYEMLRKFWPKAMADVLIKLYQLGEKSNGK